MGHQSPAKILRAVKRMTKLIERKFLHSKPSLTSVVLPGVNILPVLPTLSIVHVQSTTVPSQTRPGPVLSEETHHDASLLDENHSETVQAQDKPENPLDILTRTKFFDMVENLQWDVFKPP